MGSGTALTYPAFGGALRPELKNRSIANGSSIRTGRAFQLNKSRYDFRRYGRHCQSKMLVPKGRDHARCARDTADRRKGIGQRRPTSDPFRLVRGFADRLDDLLGESLEHPRPLPSRGRILAHDLDRSGQTDTPRPSA